jgi:chemotaxis protein MotB
MNRSTARNRRMPRSLRPRPQVASRLSTATAVILSVTVHALTAFLGWPMLQRPNVPPDPVPPLQLAFVELTPEVEVPPRTVDPPAQHRLDELQAFHHSALERTTALERTLTEALQQQVHAQSARRQQLAALESAQTQLHERVESLTTEQAMLSATLSREQQRNLELERQLQEALAAKQAELAKLQDTYGQLVTALEGEIAQREVALHQAKEKLTVTILDRVLFPSGQAALTPDGRRVLKKVGGVLAKVRDQRVLIEGHTDNVPIGPGLRERFPTNWELSTARATEVVKHLIDEAGLPASRLSAVGRADTTPVASNDDEEGRRQNRRIEIIVLPQESALAGVS